LISIKIALRAEMAPSLRFPRRVVTWIKKIRVPAAITAGQCAGLIPLSASRRPDKVNHSIDLGRGKGPEPLGPFCFAALPMHELRG
jgi:hypothetical protein